ncbi:hypothetical protein KP806_18480 [Paenibacillus sp. N4]|uniref:hypothetical protein n=1 Tax=Paenibacillus vietnamensis TaxID=2590547 RepID=UPI001CD10D4D|nr:hypothetical protein [Paenibacillus vietnamensis]MCA0757052.1 hypothetical protein [Paenibacillus vietnamensis]
MLIVSTFEYCTELELALSLLEHNGIDKSRIMVVPMGMNQETKSALTPRTATDAERAFETGIASGTACSVIGVSIGFSLSLGPLLWGIIFAAGGFLVAFGITMWVRKKNRAQSGNKNTKKKSKKADQVTVLIQCEAERTEKVSQILWAHEALSVGTAAYDSE